MGQLDNCLAVSYTSNSWRVVSICIQEAGFKWNVYMHWQITCRIPIHLRTQYRIASLLPATRSDRRSTGDSRTAVRRRRCTEGVAQWSTTAVSTLLCLERHRRGPTTTMTRQWPWRWLIQPTSCCQSFLANDSDSSTSSAKDCSARYVPSECSLVHSK